MKHNCNVRVTSLYAFTTAFHGHHTAPPYPWCHGILACTTWSRRSVHSALARGEVCALPRTCGRGPSTPNNHAPELQRSAYASEQLADTER